MNKSKPVIFFGSDHFSAVILDGLLKGGWTINLVVTKPRRPKGRGGHDLTQPVLDLSEQLNLPALTPDRFDRTVLDQLRAFSGHVGVLASYGKILPAPLLDLFPQGIINVHPSLLPRWRGPSPIETAILAGDDKTGVTLMQLEPSMDTGPIYTQRKLALSGRETQSQLSETLAKLGATLLEDELDNIVSGTTKARPQVTDGVTYSHLITKSDGLIDWTKPAIEIERQIRAYQNWPQSRTVLLGKDVIITAAKVIPESPLASSVQVRPGQLIANRHELLVQTGSGVLEITELKPSGKRLMAGAAFLRGYAPAGRSEPSDN